MTKYDLEAKSEKQYVGFRFTSWDGEKQNVW